MFEFTADHFRELCRTERVREEIATLEARRSRAVRRFWLMIPLTLLVAAAAFAVGILSGWEKTGTIGAILLFGLGLGSALQPLADTKEDVKHAILDTLAPMGGMEYLAVDFDPPVLGAARKVLFDSVSGAGFTDLFHGTDGEGKRFAVYEASLFRQNQKNRTTVFKGQIYAWQRSSKGEGEIAIVPDKGLFNFIEPSGMEGVRFDEDDAFDCAFEVYSTTPASAPGQIGTALRRRLVELSRNGKVYAYIGPEDVVVAVSGKNRFEPGSMFRSRPGEERAKTMFDDVCASMAELRQLRTAAEPAGAPSQSERKSA